MVKRKIKNVTNRESTRDGILFIFGIIFLLCFTLWMYMDLNVEVESYVDCTTGFIGIDTEGYNELEQYPCAFNNSYTCVQEEFLLKHFKIKNIDGMRCKAKVKGKIPLMKLN